MRLVEIETAESEGQGRRRRHGAAPKGRTFDAVMLAHVEAAGLWDGGASGGDEVVRPVWALLACADGARSAVVANLRCGRKAREYTERNGHRDEERTRFEFLRSAGYEWTTQRAPEGALVQVYQRGLFAFDPGVAAGDVRAMVAPPCAWLDRQGATLGETGVRRAVKAGVARVGGVTHVVGRALSPARFAALATLFAAALDRRVRAPIVPDVGFQGQLFAAALAEGLAAMVLAEPVESDGDAWWCHRRHGLAAEGLAAASLGAVVSLRGKPDAVEELLAEEVRRFYARTAKLLGSAPTAARIAEVG